MKRSSDRSIFGLEEDARNDFDMEGDHIVSIQGCEILCKHKKSEHETFFKKSKYGPESYQISTDAAISYIVMASAFDNLIPVENVHISVAQNFNLHDWPEIDNFADVERMFREHDSTFGQRHVKCIDEVSRVPFSSDMVDGSVLGYLNDIVEENYSNSSYFPEFGPSVMYAASVGVGCQSNSGCRNETEAKGICVYKRQTQNGSQYSSKDDVIQRSADQKIPTPFQWLADENFFFRTPSSSYMPNFNSDAKMDYSLPADFMPEGQLTPSSNKLKNNANSTTPYEHLAVHVLGHQESTVPSGFLPVIRMEKLSEMQSYHSELAKDSHHDTQTTKAAAEKFNSKAAQGSCLVAAMSSHDISEEALGYRQLWNVMIQLNVTTKLCIRDGLYRLAESAAQSNICSGHNESFATREMDAVAINKCKKTNTENERNSMDQSIAHLLFQKPLPFISGGYF
ncbi:uncharacterized protein LOC141840368 isoform X2 [Curcuma longa]|uniref:uncharacterized protein LOC141840368 isoform X2 n=1 Tax=Curcuma longa TaxID=136217 RepID=UPI003D9E729E